MTSKEFVKTFDNFIKGIDKFGILFAVIESFYIFYSVTALSANF